MQTVRESAKGIDDIFTRVGTLPSSTTLRAEGSRSNWSQSTISPEDSVSQVGGEGPKFMEERISQQDVGYSPTRQRLATEKAKVVQKETPNEGLNLEELMCAAMYVKSIN
jgi:hypothetical protein